MKRTPSNPEEVRKDPQNPAQFGAPIVGQGVTDPTALEYAKQIQQRRGLPKYNTPVAGGAVSGMPRLDAPAAEGLTMAEQGQMQRAAADPPRNPLLREPASAFVPGAGQIAPAPPGPGQPIGILPTDILPPEAEKDPDYRQGQGARYASSQPALAHKYGVIRGQQRIPPQQLAQARSPGLGAGSIADLKKLQELQSQQVGAQHPLLDNETRQAERASQETAAGSAARVAGGTPDTQPKMSQAEIAEAVKKLDDFDFNALRERMMKDLLNNDEQRQIIEARLDPLSIDDLIVKGYVTQRVPIIPGKFEPTFKSMSADEDLAIKRLIMEDSRTIEVSDRYLLDKFSLMGVVLSVFAINGNPLPGYADERGNFNDALFWKKFNHLCRNSLHMLASLGVNSYWFDVRVRGLFVAKNLGNG